VDVLRVVGLNYLGTTWGIFGMRFLRLGCPGVAICGVLGFEGVRHVQFPWGFITHCQV